MVTETPLKNHPGMWLAPDAAASLERYEARYGVIPINQAGRSSAEQAALVARWDKGGAANRPPYLYQPAPVGHSEHETGEAFDTPARAARAATLALAGWTFDIATDVVHAQYHAVKDTLAGGGGAAPSSDVVNQQNWLNSIGIAVGAADGIIGPKYRAGVKVYQGLLRAYGYTGAIDGIWGAGTQSAHQRYYDSKHAAAPVPASSGAALSYADIQRGLNKFGYGLVVDNAWGPKSHNALVDFQRKHGLTADALVGPKTRAALGI